MTELWLKYKDENGAPKRVLVEGEKFTLGRTPDNDLSIPLANLSRRHAQIERFADIFVLSDANSSNGTTLDGQVLTEPIALENGNKINLGGGAEIEVEIISDAPANEDEAGGAAGNLSANAETPNQAPAKTETAETPGREENSVPLGFFILAPVLGLLILGIVGVVIFVAAKNGDPNIARKDDPVYAGQTPFEDFETTEEPDDPTPAPTATPLSAATSTGSAATQSSPETVNPLPTPKISGDADKIERASVSFLRRIAANDTKAFLTGRQIETVNAKVSQFKGSSALAANIRDAKKNSAKIEELARSKNLRSQFVAAAALAELGNRQGDVAQTAQAMLETLSNLRASLGNELADDNLLIIAAYNQGAAGQNLAMRDTVAGLANKFPNVSSRTVRTIWFLKENGQLTDAQFDFALRFLAIGIITQNPKEFNVQAESVIFN